MKYQDSVLDSFLSRRLSVSASIHDHVQVTPTLFKIIATYSSNDATPDQLRYAVSAALGNEFSVVENSFRKIPGAGVPAAVGFVRANSVSKPYAEAEVASMQEVAKNILLSKDDDIWEVRSSGDEKFLVRQARDDLAQVLSNARVRAYNVPKLAALASVGIEQGVTVIAYVDDVTEQVELAGIIGCEDTGQGECIVAYTEDGNEIDVWPEQVVESAHVQDAILEIANELKLDYELPEHPGGTEDMKKYYTALFGPISKDYAASFRKMIDNRAAM